MELALNNLQRLICHKTKTNKQKVFSKRNNFQDHAISVLSIYNIYFYKFLRGISGHSIDEFVTI